MRRTVLILIAFISIFFFSNCQNPEHQAEEALKKEVFVIHDDVMPKTADINRLQRKLKAVKKDNPALDSTSHARISEALVQLEKAHDGMMVWMNNFKSPAKLRSSKSHEEIMQYLNEEKSRIEKVRDDMLSSLETGNALLAEFEKK